MKTLDIEEIELEANRLASMYEVFQSCAECSKIPAVAIAPALRQFEICLKNHAEHISAYMDAERKARATE